MSPNIQNTHTKQAASYLKLAAQEPEHEQLYIRRAQVVAEIAKAEELEQVADQLRQLDSTLSSFDENIRVIAQALYEIAEVMKFRA